MSYKNLLLTLNVIIFTALLSACGPSDSEAIKLGFTDAKEMVRINDLGYKTKEEYNQRYSKLGFISPEEMERANKLGFSTKQGLEDAKKLTPLYFKQNCIDLSAENYEKNCLGKKVFWQGEITNYGSTDGVRVQLLQDGKKEIDGVKLSEIESKSLASQGVGANNRGYIIDFVGVISKRNIVYPDVESISFYAFEENASVNAESRIARQKLAANCKYDVSDNINSYVNVPGYRIGDAISSIGFYIAAMKAKGYEVSSTSGSLITFGSADYKGRTLPACLEQVNLKFINRLEAKKDTICFDVAYIYDKEFGMYRSINTFYCDEANNKIPGWVAENNITDMQWKVAAQAPAAQAPAQAPAAPAPPAAPARAPAAKPNDPNKPWYQQ